MLRRVGTAAFVILAATAARPGDAPPVRILIIGDSAVASKSCPPGVRYGDWVAEFLEYRINRPVEVVVKGTEDAGVRRGLKELSDYRGPAPDAVLLCFGRKDALDREAQGFVRHYQKLTEAVGKRFPQSPLILATSPPFDQEALSSAGMRFEKEGGINSYLLEHFVKPLRRLAESRNIMLADLYSAFEKALREGESIDRLIERDGINLTARGNMVAGRRTAETLCLSLGIATRRPKPVEPSKPEEPEADLSSYLNLWDEILVPALLKKATDPKNPFCERAIKILTAGRFFSEKVLRAMVGFLAESSPELKEAARTYIERVAGEKALPLLFSRLRDAPLDPVVQAEILPLLLVLIRPPSDSSAQAFEPDAKVISALAKILHVPRDRRSGRDPAADAIRLLLLAGKTGTDALYEEIKKVPETEAAVLLEKMQEISERASRYRVTRTARRYASGASLRQPPYVQKRWIFNLIVEGARDRGKPYLSRRCVELLLRRYQPSQIPRDILVDTVRNERGDLADLALQALRKLGEDALDIFRKFLKSTDRDLAEAAAEILFPYIFTLDSEKKARRIFNDLKAYYGSGREAELLRKVADRLVQDRYRCVPPGRKIRFTTIRSRSFVRWDPQRAAARLRFFFPLILKRLDVAPADERCDLEELLYKLWNAAKRQKELAERPAPAPKPTAREKRKKPADALVDHLAKKAGALLEAGKKKEALAVLRRLVELGPTGRIYNSIAWKLATSPNPEVRDPKEAQRLIEQAIALDGRLPTHLHTLAVCRAAQGKFEEAVELELEAIQRSESVQDLGIFAARLLLFSHRRPYIAPAPAK